MPYTIEEVGNRDTRDFLPEGETCKKTFEGTPQPLLPILKELMRFPRPLITWNVFEDPPPPSFPEDVTTTAGQPGDEQPGQDAPVARDPRLVNNVTHMEHTAAQYKRGLAEVDDEEWLEACPSRLEVSELRSDGLYIVRLEDPDGELALGLVQVKVLEFEDDKLRAFWFARASKAHTWPSHVKFARYGRPWLSDLLPPDTFLMEVKQSDLTEAGANARDENPVFTEAFVKRLRMFAARDKLTAAKPAAKSAAKPAAAKPAAATQAAKPAAKAAAKAAAKPAAKHAAKPAAKQVAANAAESEHAVGAGKKRRRADV